MIRTLRGSICFGALIAIFIAACATTRLTSAWKDPAYNGQPRKIMVIEVAKKPAIKRIFEDEFVRQLKAHGVDAVASYTVMSDQVQDDHMVIARKVKEQGADAVLISRLVSKKTVHTYYPPANYGNCWDYYGYCSQSMYAPGYTAEDEYALMETSLYDARNDKLIWSAASETEMLGSDQDQIITYVGVMMKAMAEQNVLRQ